MDVIVFYGWVDKDNFWIIDDEIESGDLIYVNLFLNLEKYIGYKGEFVCWIWEVIYF